MHAGRVRLLASGVASGAVAAVALMALVAAQSELQAGKATSLFVIPGGSGDCSQSAPCDLRTAVGQATDGDTIILAQGVYTSTGEAVMVITRSLVVAGGWNGEPTGPVVRRAELYPSIVDGESTRRGVKIRGPSSVTLDGFTIAHGVATDDGAGLHSLDAKVVLRDMVFDSNMIDVYSIPDTIAHGGGAYIDGGELEVEGCVFRANAVWAARTCAGGGLAIVGTRRATVVGSLFEDNDAWVAAGLWFIGDPAERSPLTLDGNAFRDNGAGRSVRHVIAGYSGAVQIANATAHLTGNTFHGSMAANDYGALGFFGGDLRFEGNVIRDNGCARTSALHLQDVKSFTITNNIIANNRTTQEGIAAPAVRIRGGGSGGAVLVHNTVAANQSAYGLQLDQGAHVALTNTILVAHPVGITISLGSRAILEATLWGSGDWANGRDVDGDGTVGVGTVNVWGDPAFVDPFSDNFHIQFASAARDAGIPAGVTSDIDGDPRPAGAGYDMGADEYVAPPTEVSPTPSPTMTVGATPSASSTRTPTATLPHDASATATPSPSPSATGTREPGPTPSPTVTGEPSATPGATGTVETTAMPESWRLYLPLCGRG